MGSILRGGLRRRFGVRILHLILALALAAAPALAQEDEAVIVDLEQRLQELRGSGASTLEQARVQQALGRSLARAKRLDDAAAAFEAALAAREAALPADSADIADSLTGLGVVRGAQGRHAEAEQLFLRALEIRRRAHGEEAAEVATAWANLGALYTQMERWDESAAHFDRAIEIHEKAGGDAVAYVVALANRAALYARAGEDRKAEALLERILEIESRTHGPKSPQVASAHTALADRYRRRGEASDAEKHYRSALEVLGTYPSPPIGAVTRNLEGMGWAALEEGRLDEADRYYGRAVSILEDAVGRRHPTLVPVLEGRARVLRARQREEQSAALEKRAREIRAEVEAARAEPPAEVATGAPAEAEGSEPAPGVEDGATP